MAVRVEGALKLMVVCGMVLPAVLAGYMGMSVGLPDALLVTPHRSEAVGTVDAAARAAAPDVDALCSALYSPDRVVAAHAATQLERLVKARALSSGQVDKAARNLVQALGRPGNWWRFGWDREEPEFEWFIRAATSAAAALGPDALPYVAGALDSPLSDQREGACWVACIMGRNGTVPREALARAVGRDRITRMASRDAAEGVRAACRCARLALEG